MSASTAIWSRTATCTSSSRPISGSATSIRRGGTPRRSGSREMRRDMRVKVKSHVLLRLRRPSARRPTRSVWKAEHEGPYTRGRAAGLEPGHRSARRWTPRASTSPSSSRRAASSCSASTRRQMMGPDGLEPELAAAIARAYNDWLHDFCRAHPDALLRRRHAGAARRRRRRRRGAALRRGARLQGGLPLAGHRQPPPVAPSRTTIPLWAECERLGVAVGFHGGGQNHLRPDFSLEIFDKLMMWHTFSQPLGIMATAVSLTAGGVCERFPKLRFALLEGNCSWAPWLFYRLDEHYEWLGALRGARAHDEAVGVLPAQLLALGRGRRGDGAAVRRGVRRRQPRLLDRLPARRLEVSRSAVRGFLDAAAVGRRRSARSCGTTGAASTTSRRRRADRGPARRPTTASGTAMRPRAAPIRASPHRSTPRSRGAGPS